jgi:hypothetical protein
VYNTGNTSIAAGCFILSQFCPNYEYCRYRKILGNTGYTSIADTGRFWKILVIPVLQILEDSGKYWLYQYSIADTGRFCFVYQYCVQYW